MRLVVLGLLLALAITPTAQALTPQNATSAMRKRIQKDTGATPFLWDCRQLREQEMICQWVARIGWDWSSSMPILEEDGGWILAFDGKRRIGTGYEDVEFF